MLFRKILKYFEFVLIEMPYLWIWYRNCWQICVAINKAKIYDVSFYRRRARYSRLDTIWRNLPWTKGKGCIVKFSRRLPNWCLKLFNRPFPLLRRSMDWVRLPGANWLPLVIWSFAQRIAHSQHRGKFNVNLLHSTAIVVSHFMKFFVLIFVLEQILEYFVQRQG